MPDDPVTHNAAEVSEIDTFFAELSRREHEVRLEDLSGTVQIEIQRDGPAAPAEGEGAGTPLEHWLLRLDRGNIGIARDRQPADCVVRTGERLFGQLARGEENTLAALLRGAMTVEGDLYLMLSFERLLPSPPGTRDPRARYQEAFR